MKKWIDFKNDTEGSRLMRISLLRISLLRFFKKKHKFALNMRIYALCFGLFYFISTIFFGYFCPIWLMRIFSEPKVALGKNPLQMQICQNNSNIHKNTAKKACNYFVPGFKPYYKSNFSESIDLDLQTQFFIQGEDAIFVASVLITTCHKRMAQAVFAILNAVSKQLFNAVTKVIYPK